MHLKMQWRLAVSWSHTFAISPRSRNSKRISRSLIWCGRVTTPADWCSKDRHYFALMNLFACVRPEKCGSKIREVQGLDAVRSQLRFRILQNTKIVTILASFFSASVSTTSLLLPLTAFLCSVYQISPSLRWCWRYLSVTGQTQYYLW